MIPPDTDVDFRFSTSEARLITYECWLEEGDGVYGDAVGWYCELRHDPQQTTAGPYETITAAFAGVLAQTFPDSVD